MRKLVKLEKDFLLNKNFKLDRPAFDDSLLVGKFRIFHLGHASMLNRSYTNHIVLVGQDNLELRARVVKAAMKLTGIDYILYNASDAYLPSIIWQTTRDMPELYAGPDRIEGYNRQLEPFDPVNQVLPNPRIMSSSDLVTDLKNDNISGLIAKAPWMASRELINATYNAYV